MTGASSESVLRTALRGVLDDLGLVPPIEPGELCGRLSDRRGRRVELVARAMPPDTASGLLISYPTKDLIAYQADTTPSHQRHIVFHEIVHLLNGHLGYHRESAICGALLESAANAADVSLYDEWQEWEAETGATILSGWSGPASTPEPQSEAARRLGAVLGGGEWL